MLFRSRWWQQRVTRNLTAIAVLVLLAIGIGMYVARQQQQLPERVTEKTAEQIAAAQQKTAEHVERLVRGWRRVDRIAEASETAREHASRALHVRQDEDGMVTLRGRLTPEVGALLVQALAAGRFATVVSLPVPKGVEYADALEHARGLKARGVHAVSVLDGTPRGARMSPLALALLLQQIGRAHV